MEKIFFMLLLSFFCGGGLFAQPIDNQGIKPLIIGTTSGYAPFVSLNDQGEYEGFDIDLANALADKLGRKLSIKDFGSMPSLMIALKQGKVDALIWAISITEERLQKMEMVYYQGEKVTEIPFLFWKNIPEGITSIADLAADPKKIVSVEAGSYQEEILQQFPNMRLKYNDKIMDAILEIKFGKSFATIVDPSLIAYLQTQYPDVKVLNLPLPPEQQALGNGICISKTNPELASQIRKAVQELAEEGTIAKLEEKWNMQGA